MLFQYSYFIGQAGIRGALFFSLFADGRPLDFGAAKSKKAGRGIFRGRPQTFENHSSKISGARAPELQSDLPRYVWHSCPIFPWPKSRIPALHLFQNFRS